MPPQPKRLESPKAPQPKTPVKPKRDRRPKLKPRASRPNACHNCDPGHSCWDVPPCRKHPALAKAGAPPTIAQLEAHVKTAIRAHNDQLRKLLSEIEGRITGDQETAWIDKSLNNWADQLRRILENF